MVRWLVSSSTWYISQNGSKPRASFTTGIYDGVCPQATLSPFENKIGGLPVRFSCKYLVSTYNVRIFSNYCIIKTSIMSHVPTRYVLIITSMLSLEGSIYHWLLHIFCWTQPICCNNDRLVHLLNIIYICCQLAGVALSTKRRSIGTRFQNKYFESRWLVRWC